MSSTPLDLPGVIAQLPLAQKLVNAEQAKPEVQRDIFGPMITEQQRLQDSKVQQVKKKEAAEAVSRDGGNQEQGQQDVGERKEKQEPEEQETLSSNASPWAGNIINIKI